MFSSTPPVLGWEMAGPSDHITFRAIEHEGALLYSLKRDETTVLVAKAADLATLLERSSRFRRFFGQLGYSTDLNLDAESLPCGGAPGPLGGSLLNCLLSETRPGDELV